MENPVTDVENVIRSLTEPNKASTMGMNVEKYFTEDAVLYHPFFRVTGRGGIKGIYKTLRMGTIDQKIEFHAVMFNEDKTQVTVDLTEHMNARGVPQQSGRVGLRLIVRLHLIHDTDGKYRVTKQEDNFSSDSAAIGLPVMPGLSSMVRVMKMLSGLYIGGLGNFFLSRGWFGQ
ncbi:uncharacterized protein MELLADRAFT_70566 [Melampsora larici-populina 98AG31]|uniref:SigF-like NTF2-like domain-containing protein n=1 Tax=Melampsora larici-populina (strain 98AG31 / pathotype 3-4-7) TaxID=747676 RepID=F4R2Y0_MELLP|nr:uncharacterized protein MELLADRAFT_70566 [Melampsora larici-populina 98AG31]EGG12891.1 hypothetical protein MELLADRAFT_70566 [Melampsora larici-populina 98AG31]